MMQQVHKSWRGILVVLGAAMSCGTANATPVSIREFGAQELRLSTVAYRLSAANANTCHNPQMLTGLVLHDLTQYQPGIRAAVSSAFSLHYGIGILNVVSGSVADQAGLRTDDEILAINGSSVENASAVASAPQSYRRMDNFSAILREALKRGGADLLIRRGGELMHVSLSGRSGCGGDAFLVNSGELNAWSDGSRLFVTNALMNVATSDDELAFVIAHEMAHNILGHSSRGDTHGLLGLFGFGAAKIRREEVEADLSAIPLVSNGGFAPVGALRILDRLRSLLWWDISLDHPGFGERIRLVGAAIDRNMWH